MSTLRIRMGEKYFHVPISEIVEVEELADGTSCVVTRTGTRYTVKESARSLTRKLFPVQPRESVEMHFRDNSLFGRIFGDFFKFSK